MKLNQTIKGKGGESGNVLFLILIAVALFAALSYAVTQSTRSGAGDTASETNLISSAQLTQYPAGIRTSVVRMLIGGIAVDELMFNSPSDFGGVIPANDPMEERAVFHPSGGNATYQYAPADVVTDSVDPDLIGEWFYNAQLQIRNIGITSTDNSGAGNDVVAYLPYISTGICRRMNEEVGLTAAIPAAANVALADIDYTIVSSASPAADFLSTDGVVLDGAGDLTGQPFGCFTTSDSVNVYYHVLVER
jgi:hypothetical protein